MTIRDTFLLATRTFRTRPMRTALTILGVSVGIGAVLFLVSLGYGIQREILGKITTEDSLLTLDVSAGSTELISLDPETIEDIKNLEGVDDVSPITNVTGQISLGKLTGDGIIYVVKPNFFKYAGVIPGTGDTFSENPGNEIVISKAGVQLFNTEPDKIIGQEISLVIFMPKLSEEGFEEIEVIEKEEKFKVVGVVDDESMNYVYIPATSVSELRFDKYSQLKLKVGHEDLLEPVRNEIIEMGFIVSSLSDIISQAKKIFRVVQIILATFGLIALTVSAIGMFNTMTITLLERTGEIGIMRAIGVKSKDVKTIFLIESVLMGFLGGLGGIVLGYAGGELANFGLNMLASSFGGQALDLFYRPVWFIVFIIVFSTIIGFLTGIFPSIKASKLNPLEALKEG